MKGDRLERQPFQQVGDSISVTLKGEGVWEYANTITQVGLTPTLLTKEQIERNIAMNTIKFRAWIIDPLDGQNMIEWSPTFFSDMSAVTNWSSEFPNNTDVKLMQFTGVCDLHGKEIYVSDIIRTHAGGNRWVTSEVKIAKGAFYLFGLEESDCFLHGWDSSDLEIVSNIYEPLLLTNENN